MAEGGKLKVHIVTPYGEKLAGEADEVVAPGHLGEFGVLHEHLEFFTKNQPGVLTIINGGKKQFWAVGKGFIEVRPDAVQLLVQSAEPASDIDAARAEKAKKKAETDLEKMDNTVDPKWDEYTLRLKRAEARLEASRAK